MSIIFIFARFDDEITKAEVTPHVCHLRKSFTSKTFLVGEILPYVEDISYHYTCYFGKGDKVQSVFLGFAVLLMYFFFIHR